MDLAGTTIMQRLAAALDILDRAESHLFARTYHGADFGTTKDSVAILREASRGVRESIARLIGAKLY